MEPASEPPFKIVAWNINGATASWPAVQAFLDAEKPDLLFLGEVKVGPSVLKKKVKPKAPAGYVAIWNHNEKPGLHGTGMILKESLKHEVLHLEVPVTPEEEEGPGALGRLPATHSVPSVDRVDESVIIAGHRTEGRVIAVKLSGGKAEAAPIVVVGTYVPNVGAPEKNYPRLKYRVTHWDRDLARMMKRLKENHQGRVTWIGDLNVGLRDCDVHDHKKMSGFGCHEAAAEMGRKTLGMGTFTNEERKSHELVRTYLDLIDPSAIIPNKTPVAHAIRRMYFTFYTYRYKQAMAQAKGLRIDYTLVTSEMTEDYSATSRVIHDVDASYAHHRGKGSRVSDHLPVELLLTPVVRPVSTPRPILAAQESNPVIVRGPAARHAARLARAKLV